MMTKRSFSALCAGVLALGWASTDVAARPVALEAQNIAIAPTFLPDGVDFLIGYDIDTADPAFTGVTGVVMDEVSLVAVTDLGAFVAIEITRAEDGAVIAFDDAELTEQLNLEGDPLDVAGARAEALAQDVVSGLIWTSYEGDHRILGRRELDGPAIAAIDQLPDDVIAPYGGVRALAAARDRSLIAIVASPLREETDTNTTILGPIVGWRLAIDRAERFELERSSAFRPIGADFAPDGAFYLLETRAGGAGRIGGLRVRRFDADAMRALEEGADLGHGEVILDLTDAAPIGAMEALSVDLAEDGSLVMTMIGGDGDPDTRITRILQFTLTPDVAPE